jgi:hypothetical protein
MDNLTDLLDEQEASSQAGGVSSALAVIRELGRDIDFGRSSLEERSEIIEHLEDLRALELAAKTRRQVIEQHIVAVAERLKAKEIKLAQGSVRIELPSVGYDTQAMALRDALLGLVVEGDVTRGEVDEAIPEVVEAKPDHRRLNGLLKRGGRVQEAIEGHRVHRQPDPARAKVRIHRSAK